MNYLLCLFSNTPTNLIVSNDSSYPVVGFFCISAVNGMGNTLDDDEIKKLKITEGSGSSYIIFLMLAPFLFFLVGH